VDVMLMAQFDLKKTVCYAHLLFRNSWMFISYTTVIRP